MIECVSAVTELADDGDNDLESDKDSDSDSLCVDDFGADVDAEGVAEVMHAKGSNAGMQRESNPDPLSIVYHGSSGSLRTGNCDVDSNGARREASNAHQNTTACSAAVTLFAVTMMGAIAGGKATSLSTIINPTCLSLLQTTAPSPSAAPSSTYTLAHTVPRTATEPPRRHPLSCTKARDGANAAPAPNRRTQTTDTTSADSKLR